MEQRGARLILLSIGTLLAIALGAAALLSKGSDELLPFLQAKEAANLDIELITLPRYAPVLLF